jgi:hypothetical protein
VSTHRKKQGKICAEDMLATDIPFIPEAQLTTIDVPNPHWITERA